MEKRNCRTFSKLPVGISKDEGKLELRITSEDIIIIPDTKKTGGLIKELRVNRKNKVIQEASCFKKTLLQDTKYVDVFLGITCILNVEVLVFVESSTKVCTFLGKHDIYEIKNLLFIPFDDQQEINKDVEKYIKGIQELFSKCHYYCYTYPLTMNLNKYLSINDQIQQNDFNDKQIYIGVEQFQWNLNMTRSHFIDIDKKWNVQLIQGFVGHFQQTIKDIEFDFYLITRRSYHRSGTRFTHRGVDSQGYVANFCETEQILDFNNVINSFIQIRGSVPLMWEQKGSQGSILRLSAGKEMSQKAFIKHFQILKQDYKKIYCINLMKEFNKNESYLTSSFVEHLEEQQEQLQDDVQYEFYDFAKNKSKLNDKMLEYREQDIKRMGHMIYNKKRQKITVEQNGVFRLNCKDCLDRTNTFMMKMALNSLENVFSEQGIRLQNEVGGIPLYVMDDSKTHDLLKQFKTLWANQGDHLSFIYAGSDATTTKLTVNGYEGFSNKVSHKFTSYQVAFTRLIKSKFQDHYKQELIDIFIGNHIQSQTILPIEIENMLKQSSMFKLEQVTFGILSYNVQKIKIQDNLKQLNEGFINFNSLKNEENELPSIIVLGLQEMIEYSAFNPFKTHDEEIVKLWQQVIFSNLNQQIGENIYEMVDSHDMLGNLMIIFCKKEISTQISDIYHDSVKYGFMSKVAEYGGVVIHFKLFQEQNICFTNVCLPFGKSGQEKRLDAIKEIHNQAFQKQGVGKYKKLKIKDNDLSVILGDFNFRVSIEKKQGWVFKDTIQKAQEEYQEISMLKNINEMIKHDEFFRYTKRAFGFQSEEFKFLKEYKEDPIEFGPNYNDSTSTKRAPSWAHRVLYRNNNPTYLNIQQEKQKYFEVKKINQQINNDHNPIGQILNCEFNVIDQEMSDSRLLDLLKERKTECDKDLEDLIQQYYQKSGLLLKNSSISENQQQQNSQQNSQLNSNKNSISDNQKYHQEQQEQYQNTNQNQNQQNQEDQEQQSVKQNVNNIQIEQNQQQVILQEN